MHRQKKTFCLLYAKAGLRKTLVADINTNNT